MTAATATRPGVLEAEAIHVIREVAAEREKPVLLFSEGKDSIVLLHLARKAFRPGVVPFPVMHVDTGSSASPGAGHPGGVGAGVDRSWPGA